MKKSFFKKLSFTLALAMATTIVAPAAGAFAAAAPKLNQSKKYLFLGEDGRSEFDFNIKNKVTGSSYAWTSADEKVAVVDKGNGVTTAVGTGTTKVSVKITKKGAKAVTLKATVIVKDNIEEVKIKNAPDKDILVGQEYDFNRSFTTFGGSSKKTTAITRWFVDSEDATINADNGVFKSDVAGTYKVTAVSFQSKAKYAEWLALNDVTALEDKLVLDYDTVEVKVANQITGISQVNLNTVKVSFKAPIASLSKDDVAVSYVVANTKNTVAQVVKEVKVADDKLTATIELYNNLSAGSSYEVVVKGYEAQVLTAATTKYEDVSEMRISPVTAVIGKETDVVVKLFNKDGVDITTTDLLNRVVLKSSSEKVYFDASNKKLTIYNKGDVTTISGIYHTYVYDNTTGKELNTVEGSVDITGVEETIATIGNIAAWTIAKTFPNDDFAKVNSTIAEGDQNSGYKVFVKTLKTDGKTLANDDANKNNFRFESANTNVVIVNKDGSIYPVSQGSASVLVKYYSGDDAAVAADSKFTVIGSVNVVVSAKRTATILDLGTTGFSLSNDTDLEDSKVVTVTVKDQYNEAMTVSNLEVKQLTKNATEIASVSGSAITFVGVTSTGKAVTGTYTYEIKANGITRVLGVEVKAPTDENKVAYYDIEMDKAEYDTKLAADKLSVTATINVYGYASNSVKNTKAVVSGGALELKLFKADGTNVSNLLKVADGAKVATIDLATANTTGGTAAKVAEGTYTLKLYEGTVLKDTVTFEVKDSTVKPSLTVNKIKSDKATITSAINDCFVLKVDGKEIKDSLYVVASDIIGQGSTVRVLKVRYKDTTTGVEHILDAGATLTLSFNYDGTVN